MLSLKDKQLAYASIGSSLMLALVFFAFVRPLPVAAEMGARYERSYSPRGPAHLTVANVNGDIRVSAWDRRTILVRAIAGPSVSIADQAAGDEYSVTVRRDMRLGRADFDIWVPADTSVTLRDYMGRIEVRGITGHLSVNSIDSDVHLIGVSGPSIDVKVTSGDIFFDGDLREGGSYGLQTMKGDIDVSLPDSSSFQLNARALSENINLGSFFNSLTGSARGPKGVRGTHLRGGPSLSLTTYVGRILLHKK